MTPDEILASLAAHCAGKWWKATTVSQVLGFDVLSNDTIERRDIGPAVPGEPYVSAASVTAFVLSGVSA